MEMYYAAVIFGMFMVFLIGYLIGAEDFHEDGSIDYYQEIRRQAWNECEEWVCDVYETDAFREYIQEKKERRKWIGYQEQTKKSTKS